MIDTAAAQLKRLLTLIPRLADDRDHPIGDVAAIVGATPDQVIQDLQSLVERFDAPGGFVDGVQVYQDGTHVSVHTDHFLRPMRLTMAELCALELGLAMIVRERAPEETGPAMRALERLRAAMTRMPRNESAAVVREGSMASDAVDTGHLRTLRHAVRDRQKVRLHYAKEAGAVQERVVCPYSLVWSSGMWYVVAHCERAAALRVFRLDRVANAEPVEGRYDVPAGYDVEGVLATAKAFIAARPVESMRVRYSPRVAPWIAEREGKELSADGSLEMEHPLADRGWAVRHVLQYGAEAEVLSPTDLRDSVRNVVLNVAAGIH